MSELSWILGQLAGGRPSSPNGNWVHNPINGQDVSVYVRTGLQCEGVHTRTKGFIPSGDGSHCRAIWKFQLRRNKIPLKLNNFGDLIHDSSTSRVKSMCPVVSGWKALWRQPIGQQFLESTYRNIENLSWWRQCIY